MPSLSAIHPKLAIAYLATLQQDGLNISGCHLLTTDMNQLAHALYQVEPALLVAVALITCAKEQPPVECFSDGASFFVS